MVGLKANCSLAGLEIRQIGLVGLHHSAGIERAVVCAGAEPHEHSAVEAKCGKPIADALFGAGCPGEDHLAETLEGGALVGGQC